MRGAAGGAKPRTVDLVSDKLSVFGPEISVIELLVCLFVVISSCALVLGQAAKIKSFSYTGDREGVARVLFRSLLGHFRSESNRHFSKDAVEKQGQRCQLFSVQTLVHALHDHQSSG